MSNLNITKELLQPLIDAGHSTYGIADRLGCSQTNVRHWLKKLGLQTKAAADTAEVCVCCGEPVTAPRRKFCSDRCQNSSYHTAHKDTANTNSYARQKIIGAERKRVLISRRGGACKLCGYNKNYAVLVFHHRNPADKEFGLDIRRCSNTSMSTLLEEADKCDVLCHNCHTELHHPHCLL